ncbi:heavy-metal-associated domain-containing protein [Nocardia transvalensis]|uniref:heavy-metal-associated domain-containing protein n=1 Tax=Nocardia transvalensis TaxID=37333 RepID=UPI001893D59C|nr:heavy metal-associated domain-containing protein [Nocardia transvalensis]MBF6327762.1 heavy-metal-associated domain-containing protein [Nocardia transvalensis]
MSTYTFELPEFATDADLAERTLRRLDTTTGVDVDPGSETITVTSSLTHSEVLEIIRDAGVAAR